MKKIILLFLSFVSVNSFSQEENHPTQNFLSVDLRFSENPTYPRIYFERNSKNHWGFTFGYNADARGLVHIEGTYQIFHGIKLAAGIGNHPYQGNFHLVTGILFKKELPKSWELEGYGRMIFNHTDYFGSEIELQKKWQTSSFIIIFEFEDGKEFLLWEDAKEYHNEDFETESVFLIGPGGSIKLIEHINLRAMVLLGAQVKHQENQFFYKVGFGLKYIF